MVARFRIAAMFLSLAAPAADHAAFAADPAGPTTVLAPAGDWKLFQQEQSCVLQRAYGTGADQVSLAFEQFAPGKVLQVSVVGAGVPPERGSPATTFLPAGASEPHNLYMTGQFSDGSQGVTMQVHPYAREGTTLEQMAAESEGGDPIPLDAMRAREAEIVRLRVENLFSGAAEFRLGSMKVPLGILRDCVAGVMRLHGVETAEEDLSRRVQARDRKKWIPDVAARYPKDRLRRDETAVLAVRLIVDASGKVVDCFTPGSVEQSFAETACSAISRFGRFDPALDKEGKPVKGVWLTTVNYNIVD